MSKSSKKIKTIMLKAKYLESELQLVEEEFFDCSKEFLSEVEKRIEERKKDSKFSLELSSRSLNNGLQDIKKDNIKEDEITESIRENLPSEFKKIYRKIMLVVHPDRIDLMEDLKEKDRLKNLAVTANTAARDQDWYLLTLTAIELNISLDDVPEEYVENLKTSCEKIDLKIKNINSSYPLLWMRARGDLKIEVLDNYIKFKYKA